jgi:hypothetical protein
MLVCWDFICTLEIITRTLRLYACMLGFCRTLEIITCTLLEVVNLVAWLREFHRTVEIITSTLLEVVDQYSPEGDHVVKCM